MSSRRNPLAAAAFLIILIKVHSTLSLTCHPAEYLIGSECCPKCLPGSRVKTHCNEYRSTSCLPCVDGTYTDKANGLEQCTSCTSCDSGSGLKVKRTCTVTSDTVCEPLQGFFCISSTGDSCDKAEKHRGCEPGQYISQNDVVQLFFMLELHPPKSNSILFLYSAKSQQTITSRCFIQIQISDEEPLSLEDQMALRRNPLSSAAFLIILIKVFRTLSLTCRPGEYLIGKECCPMCLAGSRVKTHCTEYRSTSCLPCVDGTYTAKPNGLDQCTPCTSCAAGSGLKVRKLCTGTSDTVCEPLQGFYCIYSVGDDCETAQRHSSCEPGQYISRNGTASTDTECSNCRAGTFSDGTSPSCQPHTQCEDLNLQEITAGTSAADAQCGPRGVNVGAAVGVSVGLVFIIAVVSLLLFYFIKKRKSSSSSLNRNTNHEASQRRPDEEQGLAAKENGRTLSVFNHRHRNTNSSQNGNTDEEAPCNQNRSGTHHEGVHNGLLPSSDAS